MITPQRREEMLRQVRSMLAQIDQLQAQQAALDDALRAAVLEAPAPPAAVSPGPVVSAYVRPTPSRPAAPPSAPPVAPKAPPVGRVMQVVPSPAYFPTAPAARTPVVQQPEQVLAPKAAPMPQRGPGQVFAGALAAGVFANVDKSAPMYQDPNMGLAPTLTPELMSRRQKLVAQAGNGVVHQPHGHSMYGNAPSELLHAKLARMREAKRRGQ